MIYIRKIYNQDIDANHQMQVVKEPAYSFFNFPYNPTKKNMEDKSFTLHLENFFSENGVVPIIAQPILSRIYQSSATKKGKTSCEARLGSDLRNYLKANLQFEVGDILVLRNKKGKGDIDFSNIYVDYVSSKSPLYQAYNAFLQNENHCVAIAAEDEDHSQMKTLDKSLQQIFYGAPGTGKSHTINEQTEGESVIRTTFHPDSDYSTFVGAYKPTMGLLPICDELGQPMKIGSSVLHKEQIIYEFVDKAFLQAYVNAWKYYADNSEEIKKQYLIIEEINRGNCAQIFGDLFQLLDRNDYGFSVYPINADKDMKKHLEKAFKGVRIDNADSINQHYKGRNVVKEVLDGDILLLPNNLYIWATMNTSDQSLFPIDSAFKRRWEWKYVPISNAGKAWKICVNGKEYDWWSFIEKINNKIWNVTKSEDKKLGYFFCKADRKITEGDEDNNVISADGFVGKVLFYVYNDVYKDYGFDDDIFKDKEDNNSDLLFQTFFMANGKPNEAKIEVFLKNLEVKMASEVAGTNEEDNVYEIEDEDAGLEEDVVKENKVSDTNAPYKVTFPDGEVICEEYGWDTYISALRKIGLDKALPFGQIFTRMNKTLPLITDKRIQDQGPYKYIKIDGYYVLSGTDSQHRLLKKMNQDLGLGLIIE